MNFETTIANEELINDHLKIPRLFKDWFEYHAIGTIGDLTDLTLKEVLDRDGLTISKLKLLVRFLDDNKLDFRISPGVLENHLLVDLKNKIMEKKENEIADPLAIEIFAIDETFESVFGGLKGVYLRLHTKEDLKPVNVRDESKSAGFLKRFAEISVLKENYGVKDWKAKRQAIADYSEELKTMVEFELKEYATIG